LKKGVPDLLADVIHASRRVGKEQALVSGANLAEHVKVLSDEPAECIECHEVSLDQQHLARLRSGLS